MIERDQADEILKQVLELPRTFEQTVPADYIDLNGHMNVMHYTGVGNFALRKFFEQSGLRFERFESGERGMFALRQVISYLNELREGEQIAVHTGLVGYDAKRLHFIHYIVSLTHQRLASQDERVAMYMDMSRRRSTPFEPEILTDLARVREQYQQFGWQPHLSGAIQLKPLPNQ